MTNRFKLLVLMAAMAFVLWLSSSPIDAEGNNLGLLISTEGAHEGYTLFSPILSTDTFLIDSDGKVVHSWASDFRTLPVYLLENGNLLRSAVLGPEANPVFLGAGGTTGRVEEIAWDGTVVWEFEYSDDTRSLHHDVERLPNGNVLMIAWERKTAAEAIAAGRDPAKLTDDDLWPDQIIEVQPTGASGGDIVWEWNAWDHLVQDFDSEKANFGVVADHPELIDLNFFLLPGHDWHHANGLDYNPELDQIIISVRTFSEFWVIDHSTTTEEAAGHTGGNSGKGGDLLYRWGNPQAYGAGDDTDQMLFTQHDAQWIDPGLPGEGNILVFNNGLFRLDGSYSSIDEIVPPVDSFGNYSLNAGQAYGPESPVWTYMAEEPADFFSALISGVQRLPNGNTLIDEGNSGNFFEVTPDGQTVWRYVNPVTGDGPLPQGGTIPIFHTFGPILENWVFQAPRYGPDFPGLQGKDLTPGPLLELPPQKIDFLDSDGDTVIDGADDDDDNDGCADAREIGPDEALGGRRNPHDFWDWFDPNGDASVTVLDFFALLQRFGATGDPGIDPTSDPDPAPAYHPRFDRTDPANKLPWISGPPDGAVTLSDFLMLLRQFGHSCS